ncbi:hypothetical protein [Hydrogenophaga sp.]|uniref:hypothetical protein n=1 Tax=Hydrogenophaga sp. TaxID=1904254 RepID=UPI002623133C|nr:hypothetical protein [Hydrogenophaga sp.]MDM7950368.1 hypothetical protein [Hydrogenophaga sp.]
MSKKLTFSLLLIWLFVGLAAAYALWAFELQGPTKWLLYLLAGPPLYLFLSGVGELLGEAYSRLPGIRHGNEFIERRTARHPVSGLRILWYLFISLLVIGVVVAAMWVYRTHL